MTKSSMEWIAFVWPGAQVEQNPEPKREPAIVADTRTPDPEWDEERWDGLA